MPLTTPLSTSFAVREQTSSSSVSRGDLSTHKKYRSLANLYEACGFALVAADPIYFEEACYEKKWCQAMKEEIAAINKNQTWSLCKLPTGKKTIGLKWVFKTKFGINGEIIKYKARLVVKGYLQQHGIDFEETFSPVARFETVHIFLALEAQQNWSVFQFDVKSAFLNSDLNEEFYVEQPQGFIEQGKEGMVYRLKKLYIF